MSRSHYNSPRLRYLKARLSILVRPSFLMGMVFLSVVGLVIKEYWTNPEFLKFSQNQLVSPPTPTSSSNSQSLISEEDRVIAADIDNLSVLDYDQKKAKVTGVPSINNNQIKKQNEAQLTKILDLVKKNELANEIKPNNKPQRTNIPSVLQKNPFLGQAENLLKFKIDSQEEVRSVNNLSQYSSDLQTPQTLFNLGITNNNSANQNQNGTPESALKAAINQSNNQNWENSVGTTSRNNNIFGQSAQTPNNSNTPTTSRDSRLRQNGINPFINTNLFNQPLNNQVPNSYSNFNNTQTPATNYSQPGLNNQVPNSYSNFNNTRIPATNYSQPGLNNQLPNSYSNFNNQRSNNQQQNPYSNFNRNQVPINNFNNQQNFNNQVQNPYNNFNNTRITGGRYDMSTETRINNIYNRLTNRNNQTGVTPNTPNIYTSPNNSRNIGYQQPNVQQFNSTYSRQTPVQYPNNGYRY